MVKKVFYFFCLSLIGWADPLADTIENFLGRDSYELNKNFIKRLFKSKDKFYQEQGDLDYYRVAKTLKDNGLLTYKLKQPADFLLAFKAKTKPIFLIRTINNALSSMGYSYFTISKVKYSKEEIFVVFSLVAERIVDPVIVIDELKKRGFNIKGVIREQNKFWSYQIELNEPVIANTVNLLGRERMELKNISGEYWFKVSQSGVLSILKKNSKIGWSPRIVLYDKDLQILEIITQNDFTVSADVNIPPQTAFVMVTDLNNPTRLKSGITVTFN